MGEDKRWHRWDRAWKTFVSPEYPWYKQFIEWLVGGTYKEYVVDIADREFHHDDTETPASDSVIYADCILSCKIDNSAKKLPFEFQSTYDKSMALRSLQYQLSHIVNRTVDKSGEIYFLPDTVIVAVKTGTNYRSPRVLELHLNGAVVNINYPVVNGYTAVPGIKDIMDAKDKKSWWAATLALLKRLGVPRDNSVVLHDFLYACELIADEEAYTEHGIEEVMIMSKVSKDSEELKTFEEWAREEGRQEKEFEVRTKFEAALQFLGFSPEEAENAVESVMSGKGISDRNLPAHLRQSLGKSGTGPVTDLKYSGQE